MRLLRYWLSATFACGSDSASTAPDAATLVDISGRYTVTTANAGPCGALAPDTTVGPTIWIERLQNTFYVRSCSSTDSSTCGGSHFYDLNESIMGGMAGEGGTALYSGGCSLSWERTRVLKTDSGVSVTSETQRVLGATEYTESQCNLDSAEQLTGRCSREQAWQLAATN